MLTRARIFERLLVLRGILDGYGPVRECLLARLSDAEVELLPEGVSIRAAILQLGSDALVRAASGPLWGHDPQTLELTRRLLVH